MMLIKYLDMLNLWVWQCLNRRSLGIKYTGRLLAELNLTDRPQVSPQSFCELYYVEMNCFMSVWGCVAGIATWQSLLGSSWQRSERSFYCRRAGACCTEFNFSIISKCQPVFLNLNCLILFSIVAI